MLLKARALDSLNFRRRLLLKMIFFEQDTEEVEEEARQEEVGPGVERIDFRELINETEVEEVGGVEEQWDEVEEAVNSIPATSEPHLQHVAASLMVLRREEQGGARVSVTNYQGRRQTKLFAEELRLSTSMFDDHMPWGYGQLFAGVPAPMSTAQVSGSSTPPTDPSPSTPCRAWWRSRASGRGWR